MVDFIGVGQVIFGISKTVYDLWNQYDDARSDLQQLHSDLNLFNAVYSKFYQTTTKVDNTTGSLNLMFKGFIDNATLIRTKLDTIFDKGDHSKKIQIKNRLESSGITKDIKDLRTQLQRLMAHAQFVAIVNISHYVIDSYQVQLETNEKIDEMKGDLKNINSIFIDTHNEQIKNAADIKDYLQNDKAWLFWKKMIGQTKERSEILTVSIKQIEVEVSMEVHQIAPTHHSAHVKKVIESLIGKNHNDWIGLNEYKEMTNTSTLTEQVIKILNAPQNPNNRFQTRK